MGIQFGHYSGSYSLILPYTEIVSLRRLVSSGCNECVCGNRLTLNKNGSNCCVDSNDFMIEIQLKTGWRQCGSQIYAVRVSTNDLHNLIAHIQSKNANIQIIDFMHAQHDKNSMVNLKVKQQSNYVSVD